MNNDPMGSVISQHDGQRRRPFGVRTIVVVLIVFFSGIYVGFTSPRSTQEARDKILIAKAMRSLETGQWRLGTRLSELEPGYLMNLSYVGGYATSPENRKYMVLCISASTGVVVAYLDDEAMIAAHHIATQGSSGDRWFFGDSDAVAAMIKVQTMR